LRIAVKKAVKIRNWQSEIRNKLIRNRQSVIRNSISVFFFVDSNFKAWYIAKSRALGTNFLSISGIFGIY
jgi:hypothetical protein